MAVTAERFEELIQVILQALSEGEDCSPAADLGILSEAIDLTGARVRTFAEAGVLTLKKGVVVSYDDGTEFQVSIVLSRRARGFHP
jgi:hypothetical protein